MEYLSNPWLMGLLSVAGVYWFGSPLLIWLTFKTDAYPTIDVLDDTDKTLPSRVDEHFKEVEETLTHLGFEAVQTLCLPRQFDNVLGILRLYVSRREQTCVMAVTLYAKALDSWDTTLQYVEFSTRLANGKDFNTLNSNELSAFKKPPETLTLYASWMKDVQALYRLHKTILDAKAPHEKRDLKLDTEHQGDAVAFVEADMRGEFESARKDGYLKLNAEEGYYTTTLYGAYMMAWPQLQPLKAIALMRRESQARRIVEEFS